MIWKLFGFPRKSPAGVDPAPPLDRDAEVRPGERAIQLLVMATQDDERATSETVFGGAPSAHPNFAWPKCKACAGSMQFLGQIRVGPRLLLLFMCQNNPGGCNEWEADDGGNAVISFQPDELHLSPVPSEGETLRSTRYGAKVVPFTATDYDAARIEWAKNAKCSPRMVLGHMSDEPAWLQAEQTPSCNRCSLPMKFVAQLESGPDAKTEMNFGGGGCAYVFACQVDEDSAKLLWQC